MKVSSGMSLCGVCHSGVPVVGYPRGCGRALGACALGFPRLGATLESEPGQGFLGLDGVANSWLAIPIRSHHCPWSLQMRLKAVTSSSYGVFIHPTLSTLHLPTEMGSGAHLTINFPLFCLRHPSRTP